MLRNLSIRTKLMVLPAVPLALLFGTVAGIDAKVVAAADEQRSLAAYAEAAPQLNAFYQALAAERLASVEYAGDRSDANKNALDEARTALDAAAATAQQATDDAGVAGSSEVLDNARSAVDDADSTVLPQTRSDVDSGSATAVSTLQAYNGIFTTYTDFEIAVSEQATDRDLAIDLAAVGYLQKESDAASREQLAGLLVLRGTAGAQAQTLRAIAVADQADYDAQARTRLGADSAALVEAATRTGDAGAARDAVEGFRGQFDAAATAPDLSEQDWTTQTDAVVAGLERAADDVAAATAAHGQREARSALLTVLAVTLGSLLVLAGVFFFGLRIARDIAGRLKGLAEAAAEVRDELPRMVERMSSPGEGPGVEFTPIPVTSNDEIGQLKVVINDLNETTFRIAGEQAALRASIAEMFVNVARRDQTLLARQLAFLDQLERTEENPDTLEDLFTLDHLATRMRRNAESLLVLAGINTGRRLRRPLPLSDVVRTAAGEIEHYDRVDLALQVDPPVVGHLALSLSHLVAELLENATNFSDPGSRVVVGTAETERGIEVTIKDGGLGMTEEEVETAHQRISGGRASEFVGAQRLGFYVVGRLAGRLDVDVHFETAEGVGTTVTLVIGAALFTPGSVKGGEPELAALDAHAPLPAGGDTVPSALPDALPSALPSALPEALPSALPDAQPPARPGTSKGGLPGRTPSTPAGGGASTIVPNPLAAAGLGDALSATLAQSAAEAALDSEVAGTQPTSTVAGRSLPTRRRDGSEATPAPAPAPVAPAPVAFQAPVADDDAAPFQPLTAPSSGGLMPKRERKAEAPVALAAAQDILPKGGRKQRPVRDSATPPKTAAEAFWTARKRGDKAEAALVLEGSALDALEAKKAAPSAPAPQPAPVAPVAPVAPAVAETPVAPAASPTVATPTASPTLAAPTFAAPVAPVEAPAAPVAETPGPAPEAPAARPAGDALRQRSALAAEALSALTDGGTFTPSVGTGSQPLVRRQAGATAAAAKPAPARATAANRQRRAPADVRSMLSGFQAGVSRGRSENDAPAASPEGGADGDA